MWLNLNETAGYIARDAVIDEIGKQRRNMALQCRRADNWRKHGSKNWKVKGYLYDKTTA